VAVPPRRALSRAGGALAATLAGCSGGDDGGSGTGSGTEDGTASSGTQTVGTESSGTQTPSGDATLRLSINSQADDFDTLVVDIDRIVFRGDTDTDDAVIRLDDTGLDLTSLPEFGKTYFDDRPFPSGVYTSADIYLTVREADRSDGSSVSYSGERPIGIDLGIDGEAEEVPSGGSKSLAFSLTPSTGLDAETFTFLASYATVG